MNNDMDNNVTNMLNAVSLMVKQNAYVEMVTTVMDCNVLLKLVRDQEISIKDVSLRQMAFLWSTTLHLINVMVGCSSLATLTEHVCLMDHGLAQNQYAKCLTIATPNLLNHVTMKQIVSQLKLVLSASANMAILEMDSLVN